MPRGLRFQIDTRFCDCKCVPLVPRSVVFLGTTAVEPSGRCDVGQRRRVGERRARRAPPQLEKRRRRARIPALVQSGRRWDGCRRVPLGLQLP